jgi:hypothetical protein
MLQNAILYSFSGSKKIKKNKKQKPPPPRKQNCKVSHAWCELRVYRHKRSAVGTTMYLFISDIVATFFGCKQPPSGIKTCVNQ